MIILWITLEWVTAALFGVASRHHNLSGQVLWGCLMLFAQAAAFTVATNAKLDAVLKGKR